MLSGKKVLLAVSGSIAAYKAAFFVRLLVKEGAHVKVVMSESSKDFITPLTLSTLSKNPVYSDFYNKDTGEWENHVELGLWADVMVVAPASANTLAKMANGLCDNLLLATYLSAKCPVYFAPAMDLDMHAHPATTQNIQKLQSFGNKLIAATSGELASGLEGQGRMAEPEDILKLLQGHFAKGQHLVDKKILITSGPTHEAIDAVRFIGNNSSGKMGYHLAMQCAKRGATVQFISGPVSKYPDHPNVFIHKVNSAIEMHDEVKKHFQNVDVSIFTAAVADYRPSEVSDKKLKRNGTPLKIELVENPDIAAEMGKIKRGNQINVGFALETHDAEENAEAKLRKKNFDLIVLNSLQDVGAGFSHDTNKITLISKDNKPQNFELKTKQEVASDILDVIDNHLK